MSHQNPEHQIFGPQSKSPNKIKPPPGCVDIWSTLKPTNEVIAHLKSIISEYELEVESLMDNMERCKQIINTKHQQVSELQKCHQDISKLKESNSNLQFCLHQEREQNLCLYAKNDKLEIEYARAKNKIEFLLKLCGDKQTQKIVHLTCESQKPFFVRKKDSKESRDKKESIDMQQNANRDSPELLELQLKSLAAQLQISTNIHKDYVQSLLKDKDTYMQQYKSDQDRFDTQINFLANRLKETQESMLHLMHNLTTVQKRSKQKQIIWIYEKDKLVQELESCKKQFGKGTNLHCPTQKVLQMLQDKVDTLEKQISHRDKIITSYKTHFKELKIKFSSVKHQLDVSHHEAKEKESKMSAEIKHYKSKLKDLERRFCLEGEGYKNDIKRLSEHLKSLEKQFLKKKVPHFK